MAMVALAETCIGERIAELREFCQLNGIRQLALFGSAQSAQFNADSDIDLLVEFEPGKVPGLIGLSEMELQLTELLGRRVDLRTFEDLSHYFRDEVAATAQVIYAAA
jgi:uncharacterized protein